MRAVYRRMSKSRERVNRELKFPKRNEFCRLLINEDGIFLKKKKKYVFHNYENLRLRTREPISIASLFIFSVINLILYVLYSYTNAREFINTKLEIYEIVLQERKYFELIPPFFLFRQIN